MSHRPPNGVQKKFRNNCPKCDAAIDGHASSDGSTLVPDEGSFTVCCFCGTLLEIRKKKYEIVNEDEFEAYCKEDPTMRDAVGMARAKAAEMLANGLKMLSQEQIDKRHN